MKKLVIIFLFLSIGFSVSAQNKKWTLQECVEYALKNNISVKQSELDVQLSDIEKSDAFGNFFPNLNASASNSWNTGLTQNITTGVLETQTSRNSSYSFSAGVNIFNGLRNHRQFQRAKLSQLASQYNLDKMQDDIALFVANSFLQVLLNKANLKVIQSQNEVTLEQIKRTQDLVDAGVLPRGDLLEIQATNASEKQRIAVAENTVTISLISLAQLLLVKDYPSFDIVDDNYNIIDDGFSSKNVDEVIEAAKENRYEVKIAEKNVELAEKDLQIAKSSYLPSLSGFFNYNTRESGSNRFVQGVDTDNPLITSDIGIVESTGQNVVGTFSNTIIEELNPLPYGEQLYLNDGISYGVSLNVPVFNGFSVRNNVKRSKVNVLRSEFRLEQATLDLESNVYQAFVDSKGALKSYEAALAALESQKLAYQYAKDRYDVGLTNAFDFSQSKLRYDNAQIEENRSKYDYIFKLKVLELYFGVPATELKF
ncbi:MAG: outer membrane protein [Flavobacteriaceae bacterium]|jgi:outer membrane protein